ncbi:MAG: 30S ribosomal protein S12 methylthiotransferase RimO [Bacteroidales bacterium]|nr:30S ribosomal protein S12 methylthiotransferase RimO [Bacteroidales bacterium]MBN2763897.1 30S ribosomal protein S12 methylthiotransferase RimO [Bacteroidales bacterium]
MKTQPNKQLVNVITLGCSKNLVDSEQLMAQLEANDYDVVFDSENPEARTVIINTCGFINDAKEESINVILEQIRAKKNGLIDRVFVMGCLSERYKDQLTQEIPEADGMVGVDSLPALMSMLGARYRKELAGERLITTPSHYAYMKISEGCDRKCAFCAIPLIRGPHISRPVEEILKEARSLVARGVKEVILIAQDLTYYGRDIYQKQALADMLERLAAVDGLDWIRLHYAYPASFPRDVIRVIRDHKNICNYLDIPFQHISDKVLKAMRRGIDGLRTYELIDRLRYEIPGLTLRTTLMVGHPGEDEKAYDELLTFVEQVRFERLGVFAYSEEEKTYSAQRYSDAVSQETKSERVAGVMEVQEKISLENNLKKVGNVCKAIIDSKEGNHYIGRTESDSPEVDNEVIISSNHSLNTGEFYDVTIKDAEAFDLFGRALKK